MSTVPCFDSFPSPPPPPASPAPARGSQPKRTAEESTAHERRKSSRKTSPPAPDQADQFLNSLSQQIENHHPQAASERRHRHRKERPTQHQTRQDPSPATGHRKAKKNKNPQPIPVTQPKHGSTQFRDQLGKLIFTIDLREDTFNLHHGRPDRGKVPRYRRAAAGRVLGLDPHLRITFSSAYRGDGLQLSQEGRTKPVSISDPAVLQLLNDKNLKRISLSRLPNGGKLVDGPSAPFIPLVESDRPSTAVEQERVPLGINLYGEPESEEEDLEDYVPPEEDGGESFLDRLNHRKGELERRTTQHPEDVEAWLALVSLQDEMKELGLVGLRARVADADSEAISRHIQGTSDLKIAYLKRALREPANQNNEQLLLAHMKAYCDQPDLDLAKEWQKMLEAHPAVTGLWIAYVDWKQTEAGSMNVLEMVEVYEELIDRLVRRAENTSTPQKERTHFEQSIVYLFHRCCVMLKQAGYTERATAAFQAIMELNFFRPHQNVESLNELVDDLEAFWDSEVPRIGEHGAKGWTNMDVASEPLEPQTGESSPDQSNQVESCSEQIFDRWQAREMKAHQPLRTTDLQDDEDPFGCVLFDDIRNLLFLLSTDDSLQALLYSFLSFIGVSIPPPDIDTNVPFFTDPFLSTELIDVPERQSTFWPQSASKLSFDPYGPTERLSGIKKPQMIPFRIFPCDIRQLFADPSRWFVNFEPPKDTINFIKNAFQALKTTRILKDDTYFKLCELSFEARVDASSAAKLAKRSLSLDPRNYVLWDAYSRLCLLQGKPKQARDVYVKTLEMSEQGTEGLVSLWYSWAEMEFHLGHFRLVISILARAMNCLDESPSELVRNTSQARAPALLLRVRRAFIGHLAGAFQNDPPLSLLRSRVSAAASYGTFQYLTEGFTSGCEAYERSLTALESLESPAEEEELWLNYSRLIYGQIQDHQQFKPLHIRAILHRAIVKFPNNSVFLALFAFNESKMKIENHTRRLIHDILLNIPALVTVNRWLFAIWVELHLNSSTYNQAAIRGLFERALTNQSIRACLQVWVLYIEFEIRNQNFDRARSLVTRSIAHCPWAKELYLLPFTSRFEGAYGTSAGRAMEMQRMARLVDEKGVRIRDRTVLVRLQDAPGDRMPLASDDMELELGEQLEFDERIKLLPY
ncbi:hypothetical protein PTTG_01027 [Puccinia triticina 1-1 BBBD Race 1]|uniref:Suppressor of forked domain-containing protein n=2 Tax=Puccinia triticina TaxID=208348 RepID=A0A180GG11_PUCT1|nr:uncharacterized protein PtA15_3A811 [Puccinia triticina]OAV91551.1 hypothetical protein PTTG_01027 [Puccinia triticina 1-1 BBBD Race 1]WAQ83440.1 hypothetical protein PtA15_3A811 [Puccinia triticina]